MKTRIVVVVALVAAALAFILTRSGRDRAQQSSAQPARTGSATIPTPKPTANAPSAPNAPAPRWSLDPDFDGPLRMEGQVIGPDGKGVGNAEVVLAAVPPKKALAGDDGTFVFEKLVGRIYNLSAHHGDFVGDVSYKLVDGGDPVVIRIGAGAAVDVKVTDEALQPIKATVKLRDLTERTAITDDKGMASLAPVTPGWVAVEASAPGYATSGGVTTVGSAGARGTLALTLKKGVAISGKVTDERGKPLAKVRVIARGDESWGNWGAREPDTVMTDDKGEFAFAAIAPGTIKLTAIDGDHAPSHSEALVVRTSPIANVVIVMAPGGMIAGTVVSADGAPVPFATIRVAGAGRARWQVAARQTTSDKAGAFELRGLSRAKLQARAESDLAASKLVDIDLAAAAQNKDVKLVLDVTGTIGGIVVDENGEGVAEVTVNAWPDVLAGAKTDGAALAGFSSATTNGEGRFVVRGLPDNQYRLWASRTNGGNPNGNQKSTAAKVGDADAKIELPSPGGIKGTIKIAGAIEPPKRATVQLGFGAPTPSVSGAFRVEDVAPGAYDVTFHSLEFSELIQRGVIVEPGKVTDLGTVEVVRGRVLTGSVVDGNGRPVANAKVRVGERLFNAGPDDGQLEQWDALSNVRHAFTTTDGAFTIIGIPNKVTSAGAEHADGRSLPVAIPPGDGDPQPIRLVTRGFGSITGKVTKRGQPVPGVAIDEVTKGAPSQNSYAQTRDDGTFVIDRVTEGTHVVTANERRSMQSRGGATTVQVTAGRTTTANIELPTGDVSLEVQIRALAGAKLDAAQLFLFGGAVSVTTGQALVDKTLEGGSVHMRFWFGPTKPAPVFEDMPPGPYSLCSIPITGDMNDQTFMQRIQENVPTLAVVCANVRIAPAPVKQSFAQNLPAMTPLPPPS